MKLNLYFLPLLLTGLLTVGCAKDDKKDSPAPAPTAPPITYNFVNGACQASNGQIVANNLCPNAPQGQQGGFYLSNGNCYSGSQIVAPQNCTQTNPNTPAQGQCNGVYYYFSGWGLMQVNCSGTLCSGYWLYDSSQHPIFCR